MPALPTPHSLLPTLYLLLAVGSARAQAPSPPPVQRELRAAWVATVSNIDWPSRPGLSTWEQQRELLAILDRAVEIRLNAIVLQVRPATDAFYASPLEPWSEYLTGRQGRAPEPAWDPLAFAVAAAHERGLELHAWLNPYRARNARPIGDAARTHVSRTTPALVHPYGRFLWMDPGEPAVRARTLRVVADIVRRYDVDGIHIDDYFYPYRENDSAGKPIDFPDSSSYARYVARGGTLSRDDWRRENVNVLVRQMDSTVHAVKPWVRFGVSPIGIYRPGFPATIEARFDAYQEIYADTRKWLREGWLDYWVPQLYWKIDSKQRYVDIMTWWAGENVKHRNLWIGNASYRITDSSSAPAAAAARADRWTADEIVEQVRRTRATAGEGPNGGATGNVFFSMKSLMRDVDSVATRLAALYAEPALVPASPWLGRGAPARPAATVGTDVQTGEPYVAIAPGGSGVVRLWVVRTRSGEQWTTEILPASIRRHRIASAPEGAAPPDRLVITAVDRIGVESAPRTVSIPASVWEGAMRR